MRREVFKRQILYYESYYLDFFNNLSLEIQLKFNYTLQLISTVNQVPEKFFKHIKGTDGLFEIRVEYESNIYRVFCCFDKGNIIILLNGFQKKSQKTPKQEIKRAIQLKREYFYEKDN